MHSKHRTGARNPQSKELEGRVQIIWVSITGSLQRFKLLLDNITRGRNACLWGSSLVLGSQKAAVQLEKGAVGENAMLS